MPLSGRSAFGKALGAAAAEAGQTTKILRSTYVAKIGLKENGRRPLG
jgi:hypothetical protein